MRIGITVHFQFSFFSAGSPQTALGIAEALRMKGHEVTFINVSDKQETWWEDVKGLCESWPVVQLKDASGFDFCIEIGQHMLTPAQRLVATKKSVWLCRKPLLYHDMEASLFPFEKPERNLEGVSEVWLIKEHTTKDDIQYAELLFKKPVKLMPLTWTPSAVEFHRQEMKAPVWSQVAQLEELKGKPWSIHICETNMSSASSCTVPLFIMREVKKGGQIPLDSTVKIHNADNVKQSEFFRFNVLSHVFSDIQDMSGAFIGRQRVVDFVYDPKSIVIAHSRFIKLRYYLFDALWVGIPLIHNSELLKEIYPAGFYPDNELTKASAAFQTVVNSPPTVESIIEVRKGIIETFSPLNPAIQDAWNEGVQMINPYTPEPTKTPPSSDTLRVGFSDMWDDFNAEYNMFTLMLEEAGKAIGRSVRGFKVVSGNEPMDLLMFGPFGETWKQVSTAVPKVHYTGENTDPIRRDDIKLNLGFKHVDFNDGWYLRLPLWMLEINWFQADVNRIGNPKPLPIDRCCKVVPEEIARKQKFCAFVVTNPCQPMRNSAFQWLSNYKHVDSAGRLFNNMGDAIFAGRGGGGGELAKHEFLKDYKFCLAYENSSAPGYMTEKYLHAKAAGCIPIYWGDPKAERDFNMAGCIDARDVTTSGELVRLVKEVDTNSMLWLQKYSVPALDEVQRDLVRRTLAEAARRMWSFVVGQEATSGMPKMIGATEDSIPYSAPVIERAVIQSEVKSWDEGIFVTGANSRFLASLQHWIRILQQHKQAYSKLTLIVYLMNDVSKEVEQQYIEQFPEVQFRRFPTEAPEEFKDLWAPEHFAWKLWILKTLATDPSYVGRPVLYLDSGAVMVRWPREWLNKVSKDGMCVLEDPTQLNNQWCHSLFCSALKVTKQELDTCQIWAGAMAFVAGHPLAVKVLEEAWKWGQQKNVIEGPKWSGTRADGRPFGHRHDQSILSIVSLRNGVPTHPLYSVYNHMSLRQTFLSGASIYCHRGVFNIHIPVTPGIDDAWIINLERRADRLEKFKKGHPDLAERVLRLPAFEGSKLALTPRVARLFAPHDFNWKKPVMGCALSHLALWIQLANEKPEVNSYLILEDDARLAPNWRERWDEAEQQKALPDGWDVMYLGGILPPNRAAFESECIEKVNDHVARVKENGIFGQNPMNRYFHFCAYAYVLTRRGAQKILEVLKAKNGYWTSADHMICNIHQFLNIYFLHPLVAGCYQDDDPVYQKSVFNDFSRVDTFDSDLWNNKERFSEEDVKGVMNLEAPLDILGALQDARDAMVSSTSSDKEVIIGKESPSESKLALVSSQKNLVGLDKVPRLGKRRIVSLEAQDSSKWYEFAWLRGILWEANGISLEVEQISMDAPPPTDEPIVFVQRPVEAVRKLLMKWNSLGVKFYVLHLSDEYGQDAIDFYELPCCLGVVRNYVREGLSEKVAVIPLGYHWAITNGDPAKHTPRPPFRELVWSFVGTGWRGRREKLAPLEGIPGDKKCIFMDDWNSPKMLGREECLSLMLNSWCVPCPSGQNPETFRVYEALEAGAVPVLVKEEGCDPYFQMLAKWLPLLVANDWAHAAGLIHTLRERPEVYEQYRGQLLGAWEKMKADTKAQVKAVFRV